MNVPPFIEGDLVSLHAPDPDDADDFARAINREEMRERLLFTYPIPAHEEREYLATPKEDVLFTIRRRADGKLLGMCDLRQIDWRSRVAGLGVMITEPGDRGRGAGTEAIRLLVDYGFGTLGLDRIWLEVIEGNPAERLYRRLGFMEEGRFRRHIWRAGAARDVVYMSRLRT